MRILAEGGCDDCRGSGLFSIGGRCSTSVRRQTRSGEPARSNGRARVGRETGSTQAARLRLPGCVTRSGFRAVIDDAAEFAAGLLLEIENRQHRDQ